MTQPFRVIFVCLGNIVRSPLAKNLFLHILAQEGLAHKYEVDSAGMAEWHVGEQPDLRMRRVAASHGVRYDGRARQFKRADFDRFDLILAMDLDNRKDLRLLAPTPQQEAKIRLLREFDPRGGARAEVPDPYYGGLDGFEEVYQIVERSLWGLLEALEKHGEAGR
ncbi:MAG: low molecular weight phosphotyrosine protein phosphatase [Chloroflexi bacterium]|nr:low molecular weight phosphotyrosine protein phosphatase [Chloroflexota bacterium]